MTSSVPGSRWIKHPLLEHALGGPTPVEFYLRFVTFDPAAAELVPVKGATMRVVDQTGTTLKAAQPPAPGLTDLQATTDANGEVVFKGMISLVTGAGLTLHFELDGLSTTTWYAKGSQTITFPLNKWSTAGWKSTDGTASGTLKGFAGKKLGDAGAPVEFSVGVPCWLKFRYQRKYGENPAAAFPSGTRLKLVALDSNYDPVDIFDIRTDATSEYKDALFNVEPGTALRLLVFTRFSKAADDDPQLVLNPFDITSEDATSGDPDDYAESADEGTPCPFLYYESRAPKGYAFHFKGWEPTLKKVDPWINAADLRCLSTWDAQNKPASSLEVLAAMPVQFQEEGEFLNKNKKLKSKISLCVALHIATLVREFHGLLTSLHVNPTTSSVRPEWKGLNVTSSDVEAVAILTKDTSPQTVHTLSEQRGVVNFPIRVLFDPSAFSIKKDDNSRNEFRYLVTRNIILHELGHCVMFKYSFDKGPDDTLFSDHYFNLFVEYSEDTKVLAFWEGWAVYFSILLLGPQDFLSSQMVRIAAKDGAINSQRDSLLALISSATPAVLDSALANIFTSGIIPTYSVGKNGEQTENGKSLDDVKNYFMNSSIKPNIGQASEMCLAFSLYTLTRFLVGLSGLGHVLAGPGPSNGNGCIPLDGGQWYRNGQLQNRIWTAIFKPFMEMKADVDSDTAKKFATAIMTAVIADPELKAHAHKILKIFNTYYLLVEPPQVGSINPSTLTAGANPQVLTITGMRFPAEGTDKDGGLRVEIVPSSATLGSLSVTGSTEVKLTATFPTAGSYTLKFLGRWDPPVTETVTVNQ